jgi:tetratricopeptide (TPR) repeat protein
VLIKGLLLTAIASTPLAFVVTQEPAPAPAAATESTTALQRLEAAQRQTAAELDKARQELANAQQELARLRQQLDHSLTALDATFEPQRDRNCAPSRGRALMSHYRWLHDEGHAERAAGALAKVVDQIGEDQHQRNSAAWNLMTDKQTVGKFDDVALAIAQRMEQSGAREHHQLDTIALAYFLSGHVERAIELEQKAIVAGGNGDEYRRRLRTYEAARDAVAKAPRPAEPVTSGPVATSGD